MFAGLLFQYGAGNERVYCASIELQGGVKSKHAVMSARHFLRHRRPSEQTSFPVHGTQICEFFGIKKGKKLIVDFSLISFVISQLLHNKLQNFTS